MFPGASPAGSTTCTFLCLRRGVSICRGDDMARFSFSLPTQRCFRYRASEPCRNSLFSAYAEVFPWLPYRRYYGRPFLCLRRGVSKTKHYDIYQIIFSLPTQRCFCRVHPATSYTVLFSAYAEVFLTKRKTFRAPMSFSLPTQRCFDV